MFCSPKAVILGRSTTRRVGNFIEDVCVHFLNRLACHNVESLQQLEFIQQIGHNWSLDIQN
jgi:hypothetical protein